jgi:hypothetical protein
MCGTALANVVNFPLAATLCYSGMDGGWPMIFYVPGQQLFNQIFEKLLHSHDMEPSFGDIRTPEGSLHE